MKILVFSAHAADFCTRAGGTIAKHVQNGDTVYVIALSDGERSESGDCTWETLSHHWTR